MNRQDWNGCSTPDDPLDNFKDFLGKFTIVLNGTGIQKRADQPDELSFEHKFEVVEKAKRLLSQAYKSGVEDSAKVAESVTLSKLSTYDDISVGYDIEAAIRNLK